MKEHDLKIRPVYFEAVAEDKKKFELRKDDRPFKEGDALILNEWDGEGYTGRRIQARVDFILRDFPGIEPGYCIMSITRLGPVEKYDLR